MSDYYFNGAYKSTNVRDKTLRQGAIHSLLSLSWRLVPGWTRQMVLRLFFSPKRYRTNQAERACLAQGRPFKLRVHEKDIHAWRWGEGPSVLLVHGWSGSGIQFHRFIAPLVAAGYTAIAIDGPAHGASTGRITSYFEFTDVIRKFLAAQETGDVRGIIAHSFGGAAVINALSKEGMSVNAVCIAPVLKLEELLHGTFDKMGVPRSVYISLIKEFEDRYGYNLSADNPCHLLGSMINPVMIIHDTDDRAAPYQESVRQARKNGHVTLETTSGLGHRRLLTDEDVVARSLAHLAGIHTAPKRG